MSELTGYLENLLIVAPGAKFDKIQEIFNEIESLWSPADVVRVLVSFHTIEDKKVVTTTLHRLLLMYYRLSQQRVIRSAWMELGLHPQTVYENLVEMWSSHMEENIQLYCFTEWFKYVKLFEEKHPGALSAEDAVRLLFQDGSAEELDRAIKSTEHYGWHKYLV